MALLVTAFLLGMGSLIFLTGAGSRAEDQRDVAVTQRDDVAQDARDDASVIAALCRTGGQAADALDAAGQCGRAAQRLTDPAIANITTGLTGGQIDDIVARVLRLTPRAATVDQVVPLVLAQIRADPAPVAPTESDIRAIVAAALAAQPPPRDGTDGEPGGDGAPGRDGRDGMSLAGLVFVLQDGRCVAIATFVDAEGQATTQTSPVGSAACADAPAPTVAPSPGPGPEPTTDPPPEPTTDPPADQPPEPAVDPTIDPPPDPTTDPAIIPGVIG